MLFILVEHSWPLALSVVNPSGYRLSRGNHFHRGTNALRLHIPKCNEKNSIGPRLETLAVSQHRSMRRYYVLRRHSGPISLLVDLHNGNQALLFQGTNYGW